MTESVALLCLYIVIVFGGFVLEPESDDVPVGELPDALKEISPSVAMVDVIYLLKSKLYYSACFSRQESNVKRRLSS